MFLKKWATLDEVWTREQWLQNQSWGLFQQLLHQAELKGAELCIGYWGCPLGG